MEKELGTKKSAFLKDFEKAVNAKKLSIEKAVTIWCTYKDLSMASFRTLHLPADFADKFTSLVVSQKMEKLTSMSEDNIDDILKKIEAIESLFDAKASATNDVPTAVTEELNRLVNKKVNVVFVTITPMPENSIADCQEKIRAINGLPKRNADDDIRQKADSETKRLEKKIMGQEEDGEWQLLNKGNYNSLLAYRTKYPQSVHLNELDELMWQQSSRSVSEHTLKRYINDWPSGRYVSVANATLIDLGVWLPIKEENSLLKAVEFRDNRPDCLFKSEVDAFCNELRDTELEKMKENLGEYNKDTINRYFRNNIFTMEELKEAKLISDSSWRKLNKTDRDLLPNIKQYQIANPHLVIKSDCTDVFLFGTPGTGKTCLLMGLAGANGNGYDLNTKIQAGPYAAALAQYVREGITPGRTNGNFVNAIYGSLNESNGDVHEVNFVEMSGEEFASRIADNEKVTLGHMGTGADKLFANNNRKVFLIIVDASSDRIKAEVEEPIRDAEGTIVSTKIVKKYIDQNDILTKFVGLFTLDENRDIMKKVDAIHFVVTKADYLGDGSEREDKAYEMLKNKYVAPVSAIKNYIDKHRWINVNTGYRPKVFTFSLGKFYLGDVFDFDNAETLRIVQDLKRITRITKKRGLFDKLFNN